MKKVISCMLFITSLLSARTRIDITLDSNIEFDLSLYIYPPLIFPTYFYPTSASARNPQGIRMRLGYQRRPPGGHTVSTLYLETRGSGDFSSAVTLDQLYYAPDGEPLPQPGNPPGGNWQAYTTLYQLIEVFPVVGNRRRFTRLFDFMFQSQADDEPVNSSITLYFRLYGL